MSALLLIEAGLLAAPALAQDATQTTQAPADQPTQSTEPDETAGPNPGTTTDQAPTQAENEPAADAPGDQEEIVVTGSILRRTNAETPSPVTVMSAESLAQRGINTVAEAAQRVSANGAGTMTQGWNAGYNFATGANAISLRGLTVQSTLTIFDGLRMAPFPLADDGSRNFVDLNTIPNAVIDRIEVLRDGASSTYGADAIAGVVNVITKRQVRGIHLNGTIGTSSRGDAEEYRLDGTFGYGDLDDQGFNVYVTGELQNNKALWARDRGYPFNTEDWSRTCEDGSTTVCLRTNVRNDLQADGTNNGLLSTPVPIARPIGAPIPGGAANPVAGLYTLLNPAAGCGPLDPITFSPAEAARFGADPSQCTWDRVATQGQLQPSSNRKGLTGRLSFNLSDRATVYVGGNFYNVKSRSQRGGLTNFANTTTPAGGLDPVLYNPVLLPVYVCAAGIGEPTALATGCDATNGVLNPNNPYAAQGLRAQVLTTLPLSHPYNTTSDARSLRGVVGVDGSFGDDWNYAANFTASNVTLDITQRNAIVPRRLMEAIARGTYNFVNPEANSDEAIAFIAPKNETRSHSDLWQASGSLTKALFELPGGPLQAAVGLAYRKESVTNPSANPGTTPTGDPFERYYTINAVGAEGSRNVKSGFFEISAPIIQELELNLSGRYDKYSSGQKNFSPKIGGKFTPIKELAIRGTYSKGFRIPSFNEAFGLPTTGYITQTLNPANNPDHAAFIAAHNNSPYATQAFPIGLTSTGNPTLEPEKSTGMTFGGIFEPIRNVSFTLDFWRIKVDNLIASANSGPAVAQYYANNGVVNIPGVTVIAAAPDPQAPGALPHLGFVVSSFQNANNQVVSGIDFGANARVPIGFGARLTSSLEASYLRKYDFTDDSGTQHWAGTLSPCNVTSCSGAPKWRASWQNTVDVGRATLSVTTYYTKGVDNASIDFGGVKGDCAASAGASVLNFRGGGAYRCSSGDLWNVDMTGAFRMNDRVTLYGNVLNLFDIQGPFDPDSTYHLTGYNPAFAGANVMGRFFRLGAKLDF